MSASRPRIAVDLRALVGARPTGIGHATRALLLALARRKSASYLGLAHAPVGCAAELEAAGVEIEIRRAPLGVLWQQLWLPVRLARGDVDLYWSPIHTLPSRLEQPAIVTVHDLSALAVPEMHTLRHRLSVLPFLRSSLSRADRIAAVSEATAAEVRRYFPECGAKIAVVPNGVEPVFRPGKAAEITATREKLRCPRGYVLSVATLEPRKNLGVLFDAWECLASGDPSTPPLLLAGASGWKNRELERRLAELGALGARHLGYLERPELVRVFQAARAFVYPSLYEGFGLPALEALACGIPTIVSDRTSLPEIVGAAGTIFPAEDPRVLAAGLRQVLDDEDEARRLARLGIERAASFTWERAADGMERLFEELPRARTRR
jgi:alpha-1,3-rhamnosyl/mannosyltransferase